MANNNGKVDKLWYFVEYYATMKHIFQECNNMEYTQNSVLI